MSAIPWMPLYVAEYLGDTGHLTTTEHGAYLLLIMHYWQAGKLPTDDKKLARIVRLSDFSWSEIRENIAPFFSSKWKHSRIDRELQVASDRIGKRSAAGRAGAYARYGKRMANAKQTNAPVPSPEPVPKKIEDISSFSFGNGAGKKSGNGSGTTTIKDPIQRLARFQQKLIPLLGAEAWTIIDLSMRPSHPEYLRCLDLCKAAAKKIDKGWPTNWPTVETENASAKEIH